VTPLQVICEHPVGQEVAVDISFSSGAAALAAAFLFLLFLCFFALSFGAGCAACSDAALEDGAGATSAAQAGTTIKANNSNIFFMVTLSLCG